MFTPFRHFNSIISLQLILRTQLLVSTTAAAATHLRTRWLMEAEPPQSPPQEAEKPNNHIPSSSSSAYRIHGMMGKHRMAAAITHLNQEIQIIQDELDQLETVEAASTICQELIASVESVPDALIPVTRGPLDVRWDKWFQGAQSSRNRKRWI